MADYGEDWLQRITAVHWRDKGFAHASFIFGGFGADDAGQGGVWLVTANQSKLNPTLIRVPLAGNFEPTASTFAAVHRTDAIGEPELKTTPTFLVAGNRTEITEGTDGAGNPIHITVFFSTIYYSNDGLDWVVVRDEVNGGDPMSLVWDPSRSAFFYDEIHDLQDNVYTSSDGAEWSLVGSTAITDSSEYRSTYPSLYCSHNDCVDDLGYHVPDGVMMLDPSGTLLIRPQQPPISNYGLGLHSYDTSSDDVMYGNDAVEVVSPNSFKLNTIPGISIVTCVAGVNGFWLAGGFVGKNFGPGSVAISYDNGETWSTLAGTSGGVLTMVAGGWN